MIVQSFKSIELPLRCLCKRWPSQFSGVSWMQYEIKMPPTASSVFSQRLEVQGVKHVFPFTMIVYCPDELCDVCFFPPHMCKYVSLFVLLPINAGSVRINLTTAINNEHTESYFCLHKYFSQLCHIRWSVFFVLPSPRLSMYTEGINWHCVL